MKRPRRKDEWWNNNKLYKELDNPEERFGFECGYNQACADWEEHHEEIIKEIRKEHQEQTKRLQDYWEGQAKIIMER